MALIDSLATTARISRVFSDENVLGAMLAFEGALARAECRLGIVPAMDFSAVNFSAVRVGDLAARALRAGTPAIPLVADLREQGLAQAHWGATSQDVVDTSLMLLLRECRAILEADFLRIEAALARLAEEHAGTVMLGRTLLQPAPPVTFGLKAAGWLAAVRRGWGRVASRYREGMFLQFGGASGTLAALGERGLEVSAALAAELDLPLPDAPWHGFRDRLAALFAAMSIYTGTLGKMALDVALLMQEGEVAEPGDAGRGGSSTMPHKRNPVGSMLAVAAARRVPGLYASFLQGLLVEQERALGGWQSEWTLAHGIVQSLGVASESMVEVMEGLTVDAARMRANLEAHPEVFAERERFGADDAEYLGCAEAFRVRLVKGGA